MILRCNPCGGKATASCQVRADSPARMPTCANCAQIVDRALPRIGHAMLGAVLCVGRHPGTTIYEVSRQVGPHGSTRYGRESVMACIRGGLVVRLGTPSRTHLHLTALGGHVYTEAQPARRDMGAHGYANEHSVLPSPCLTCPPTLDAFADDAQLIYIDLYRYRATRPSGGWSLAYPYSTIDPVVTPGGDW